MDRPWPVLIVGVALVIMIPMFYLYTFHFRGKSIKAFLISLTGQELDLVDIKNSYFSSRGKFYFNSSEYGLFNIYYEIGKRELWYFVRKYDAKYVVAVYGKSLVADNCVPKGKLFSKGLFKSELNISEGWEFLESTGDQILVFYPLPHFTERSALKALLKTQLRGNSISISAE